MAKEKKIKGKTCRYYRAGFVWVSKDGSILAYKDTQKTVTNWGMLVDKFCYPRKKRLADGRLFVEDRIGNKVMIDKAVITCWCKPIPSDGQKYMISHKDGNLSNNDSTNLEWVPYHYRHSSKNMEKINYKDLVLTVYKNGTVKHGSQIEPIIDYRYDSDMDYHYCTGPCVSLPTKDHHPSGELVDIDILMKNAGYVQGDNADLSNPVILHIDNDWKNFDSSNLKFVEVSDPDYVSYQKIRKKSKDERRVEIWKVIDKLSDEDINGLIRMENNRNSSQNSSE